jgi:hypothetical protein
MPKRGPVLEVSDELLAQEPPEVHLSRDELNRVARLALLVAIAMNRRERLLGPEVRWEDKTPEAQGAARLGVLRVIQALALLGYLEIV